MGPIVDLQCKERCKVDHPGPNTWGESRSIVGGGIGCICHFEDEPWPGTVWFFGTVPRHDPP